MHYVILGAGPAGVTAAETIRKADMTGQITMIGGEPEPPYSRMAIPYLLAGNIAENGTYLRQEKDHYDRLGITYRSDRAGGIDTAAKRLFLASGANLNYDKLLIATGATPIIPRMDGSNLDGVHTCWTLPDARAILARAGKGSPVVLVGAGFIGSIVLEALHKMGCDITVVEIAPRMVARMLDETAGGMLGRWSESKGVKVLTNTKVERITGSSDGGLYVSLSNGTSIPAKLVVMAAGVKSNTGFLVGTNVKVNWGIVVDNYLQTTVPDVYAAGDCCEAIDLSTGKPDMLAIQPVAVEHGRIAGLNMAGLKTPHRGSLNMNVLDTMGLISSSFGLWQGAPGGTTAKLIDNEGFKYLKLEFLDDRLVGAQCVGLTDHVGMLRGLIQTGVRLGEWKDRLMKSPDRLCEAYIATAQIRNAIHGPAGLGTKNPVAKVAA
jgi:NAD(P)H-nitrite reductase large subunit